MQKMKIEILLFVDFIIQQPSVMSLSTHIHETVKRQIVLPLKSISHLPKNHPNYPLRQIN